MNQALLCQRLLLTMPCAHDEGANAARDRHCDSRVKVSAGKAAIRENRRGLELRREGTGCLRRALYRRWTRPTPGEWRLCSSRSEICPLSGRKETRKQQERRTGGAGCSTGLGTFAG